jgi:hypothetical protein
VGGAHDTRRGEAEGKKVDGWQGGEGRKQVWRGHCSRTKWGERSDLVGKRWVVQIGKSSVP